MKLSDAEKENLSEVLDVLLKYSNINKDSKCPHIEGIRPFSAIFNRFSVDKDRAQELIAEINQLAQKQAEEE